MSDFIKEFIKKNKPKFETYKVFIQNNNWLEDKPDSKKSKIERYKLENDLISYILNRLKVFVDKSKGEHNLKTFKTFTAYCLDIVNIHLERIDEYIYSVDISCIENEKIRDSEIKLMNVCHEDSNNIEDKINGLNIKEEQATEGIQWLDDQKATIAMHETLIKQFPEIKVKLDKMEIDFESEPPKTIHILNENPPEYNPNKNYWEQDKEVLQYYVDEYKKIERGIEIDGYYIDGWLYFHFNFFVTNIPTTIEINGIKENKDIVKIPELRDNEILITDYFIKSKREGLMSLIAATRRAAKTTLNSSRIVRAQLLNKKQILCAGGSAEDLNHIHNNLDTYHNNCNSAFKMYYLSPTEDGRGKSYGIKTKKNKSKITNNVFILNLEGGTKKGKQESLAGFTPDEFILDEAMKFPFKKNLLALESALWGSGVLRCSVLITGTGGSDELAKDAISMLNNPKGNKVTLMDWDSLEKNIDVEDITWRRKPFGLFLPTQMCIKHEKIKSNLADYLGIESETLSKIPLWITDWKNAKKREQEERQSKIDNRADYIRFLAYHPFDPEEIFLSGKISPFVDIVDDAKRHRDYLIETGKWDMRFSLHRDSEGKIIKERSKEDLIPFPFSGGNKDAPYLIIEEPDKIKIPKYYYVCGGDFCKQEASESTDSVNTIYVFKFPLVGDKSGGKLVASWSGRPKTYKIMCERFLLLQQYYNAIMLPEDIDLGVYQTFLENRRLEDTYLEKHIDFKGALNYSNSVAKKYGWTPQQSKNRLIAIFRKYLEELVVILNDADEEVEVKRVQTIDDIHLLSEIIAFSENGNYDRLISAMGGVGFIHFLENTYKYPRVGYQKKENEEEQEIKPIRKISHYTNNNRRNYSTRRR